MNYMSLHLHKNEDVQEKVRQTIVLDLEQT